MQINKNQTILGIIKVDCQYLDFDDFKVGD